MHQGVIKRSFEPNTCHLGRCLPHQKSYPVAPIKNHPPSSEIMSLIKNNAPPHQKSCPHSPHVVENLPSLPHHKFSPSNSMLQPHFVPPWETKIVNCKLYPPLPWRSINKIKYRIFIVECRYYPTLKSFLLEFVNSFQLK